MVDESTATTRKRSNLGAKQLQTNQFYISSKAFLTVMSSDLEWKAQFMNYDANIHETCPLHGCCYLDKRDVVTTRHPATVFYYPVKRVENLVLSRLNGLTRGRAEGGQIQQQRKFHVLVDLSKGSSTALLEKGKAQSCHIEERFFNTARSSVR